MTKTEIYSMIKELVGNSTLAEDVKKEITDRMDKDIEIAGKKSTSTRKPTAHDLENDKIKDAIVEVLGEAVDPIPFATLLTKTSEKMGIDIGKERMSALVTQLGEGTTSKPGENVIKKSMVKKVRYIGLA